MAQYDGSIRIDTQINTKNANAQLMSLESRIVKMADKISALRSRMDALKDAEISTQEYKDIETDIAKAERVLDKLLEKQAQMQQDGRDNGSAWDTINQRIQAQRDYVELAREEMQELVDTGRAFTLGSNTQEYSNLGQQLEYLENDYSTLIQRRNEFMQRHNIQAGGYERLQVALQELKNSMLLVMHPIEAMKSSFSSAMEDMKQRIAGIAASIINGIAHPFQAMKNIAGTAVKGTSKFLSGMASIAKKVGKAIGSVASILKKATSSMFSFGKSTKSSNNMLQSGFKNILKYGLGIRSFYALINKFRTGAKEGFGNLAQYSEPVNTALSSLKSSLLQLKNSLATAFAPILTVAAPALTALIDMASRAATAIGMLIAALTGQKTFVKAKKVQQGYADSLKGTSKAAKDANKQLSSLDKLNNLTSNDSGDGGGDSGGGAGAGDMFETVDIPSQIGNFADMIKKAWEEADFTEIGGLIGTKLREALESIPWEGIQATAEKVGKSLATLINGFVEVEGLGYTIGYTIAQAINTGLIGLEQFAANLHWDSVGKFISDGINGVLENIDWATALSVAHYLGTGIATALNNALTPEVFSNIGYTIGMGLNTALTFANDFLTTFQWKEFGSNIANGIKNAISTIDWGLLGDTVGNAVQSVFDLFIGFVESNPLEGIGEKIGTAINRAIEKINLASFTSSLSDFVIGLLGELSKAIETVDWGQVAKDVVDAIKAVDWMGIASGLFDVGLQLINAIFEAFKALPAPIQAVGVAIGGFLAAFSSFSIITKVVGAVQGIISVVSTVASVLGGPLTIAIAAVVAGIAALVDLWNTSDVFRGAVVNAFNKIKDSVVSAFNKVKNAASPLIKSIKELGEAFYNFYEKSGLKGVIELIASLASTLAGSIISTAIDAISSAFSGLLNILNGSIEKISGVLDVLTGLFTLDFDKVVEGFEKIGTGIIDEFSGILDTIIDIGTSIIDGLLLGILDKIKGIGSWIKKNIFNPFIKGFKNAFGIHSPSTVMAEQGNFIVEGIRKGITDKWTGFLEFWAEKRNAIVDKFKDIKDKFLKKGESIVSGIKGGIKDKWGDFIQDWAEKRNAIVDKFKDIKDKFLKKGESIVSGIKGGIKDKWGDFIQDWAEKRNAIVDKFKDIKDKFLKKGESIVSGIKSGIEDKWGGFSSFWSSKKKRYYK